MAAARRRFEIEQGGTFRTVITWKPGGVVMNLTGCTATMKIRRTLDTAAFITLTSTPAAGITLGGIAGTIEIVLTDEQTAALTHKQFEDLGGGVYRGVYELVVVDTAGETTPLFKGNIFFRRGVAVA